MNNSEFISFIDELIKQESLLGSYGYTKRLTGLNNIKTDFNYVSLNEPDLDTKSILQCLLNRRKEEQTTIDNRAIWLQIHTEITMLENWLSKK